MNSHVSYEPYYPEREPNIFDESIHSGPKRMNTLKRKLEMSYEPVYETYFDSTEKREIHANHIERNQPMDFEFGSWTEACRFLTGKFYLKVKFTKPDGTDFPTGMNDMRGCNAWLREGFMTNVIKEVEVLVNGRSIPMANYDHIARMTLLMTMPKDRLEGDWEKMRSDFGIARDEEADVAAGRSPALEARHTRLTPDTMPSNRITATSATEQSIDEQKPYNDRMSTRLLGSKEHVFSTYLQHPLFNCYKLFPPATPFRVRVTLNEAANCFQCTTAHVPRIHIVDAYFRDHLIRVKQEVATSIATSLVSKGGNMIFPIVRKTISEINLPKARSITLNRAVLGTLPSRLMMVIVPNSVWKTNNPTKNPYVYRYPGLTNLKITYGDKEWPKKDGLEFKDVPENKNPRDFTDEEIDQMVRSNVDTYATMREVFTPNTYLHRLAVTPHDFFKYNFVMGIDLSPLAVDCLNHDTREPRYEGDLTIKMDFNHMLGENDPMMLIICAEHKNQITWHLPDFTLSTDY